MSRIIEQNSLETRIAELERQIQTIHANMAAERERYENEVFNRFSTLNTNIFKRLLFRIDGWGPWHIVREAPRWRPWRRWWTS
jgi:molecular chaperone GrpE (heat shock protein)